MPQRYWLMKCEPAAYTIDDLERDRSTSWEGVRNYQARNFMRDQMRVGDGVLFYHSSCPQPGIAGLAEVVSGPRPDDTQFDPDSPYYDSASTREKPRWVNVDVKVLRKTRLVGLDELRAHPELADMVVLRRGNRLSITPVTDAEWKYIVERLLPERS